MRCRGRQAHRGRQPTLRLRPALLQVGRSGESTSRVLWNSKSEGRARIRDPNPCTRDPRLATIPRPTSSSISPLATYLLYPLFPLLFRKPQTRTSPPVARGRPRTADARLPCNDVHADQHKRSTWTDRALRVARLPYCRTHRKAFSEGDAVFVQTSVKEDAWVNLHIMPPTTTR